MNMGLTGFYRLYLSILAGALAYYTLKPAWWVWVTGAILFRIIWFAAEKRIENVRERKWLNRHSQSFKDLLGPYGIRIINKAESDPAIRKSLSEVFTPNINKLKAAVDQLQIMDTLYNAGMRPGGDTYLLHDLKLKYGKYRLEKISCNQKQYSGD
ncbi:MAG: hypothetical protein GX556_19335 [Fibrobacter sp.]|nr:hypothetical protein [Fibrobacter sp.]